MFTLKLDTDNASFCADDPTEDSTCHMEIARVLREAAKQIEIGKDYAAIMDENGNRVGQWELVP
jgi:hypothetical protein